MRIAEIINMMNEQDQSIFADSLKFAENASKTAFECATLLKNTPKESENYESVRKESLYANAVKQDCIKAVQDMVDTVFVKHFTKDNAVNTMKAFFSDIFRPVLSISVKGKNHTMTISWNEGESVSVFSLNRALSVISEKFKQEYESMNVAELLSNSRIRVSAYVLNTCLSSSDTIKAYKADYLANFGEKDSFVVKENCGRNRAEKSMQDIVCAFFGADTDIRVHKDFLFELALYDGLFDRDNKTGKAYLVDIDTFIDRLTVKLYKLYNKVSDIATIK